MLKVYVIIYVVSFDLILILLSPSRPPHHNTHIATINYLSLNGRIKGDPLIKSYILCPTVQGGREVTREKRTNIQQQPTHTIIASFSTTIFPTNTTHSPISFITLLHKPSSAKPPFLPRPLSKIHPTILWPPQFYTHLTANRSLKFPTHQEMSHVPLPQITHLLSLHSTSLLILQQPS